jgi:hypothetical protein
MYFHHGCEARGKAWSGLSGDIGQWVEGLFFSLSVRILAFSVFLFFATQAHGDEGSRKGFHGVGPERSHEVYM